MTTLVYDTLETTPIQQTIELEARSVLHAICPYLYIARLPAGTITLSIIKDSVTLASDSLTQAEILAGTTTGITTLNYFHGFLKFDFENQILNKGSYTIELKGEGGYTFTEASHYGWVKEFENRTNRVTSEPSNLIDSPHSMQIWSYKT